MSPYFAVLNRFKSFARVVIKNHLCDFCHSLGYKQIELTILDQDPEDNLGHPSKDDIADREPTPSHEAERNEIRGVLRSGLDSLTPAQREVLENYAAGRTFAELARRNGTTEQAVRQMFERGLRQIRPRLEASGVVSAQMMPAARGGFRMLPDIKELAPEPQQREQLHSSSGRPRAPIAWPVVGAVLVALLILLLAIGYLLRTSP